MASPDQDQVTFWAKLAIGLIVVLIGLQVIERISPRLGSWYVVAILLGVILTNRSGFNRFTSFILSLTSPNERAGSR